MEHTIIVSKEKLNEMLEEDEKSRRNHINFVRYQEVEGFLYSVWIDNRSGNKFAAREIRSVYMGFNSNGPGKEEEFVSIMEKEGVCKAYWGVTGRTMHSILAKQFAEKYPQYRFEIGYNYECTAYKKEV